MCYSLGVETNIKRIQELLFARERASITVDKSSSIKRIYPSSKTKSYTAPIIVFSDGKPTIIQMAYQLKPPSHLPYKSGFTFYNARCENLLSEYWSEAFKKNHGLLVAAGFYEQVLVKNLLLAGEVSIDEVERYFTAKMERRRQNYALNGKPFRHTATELKPPQNRYVEVCFSHQNKSYCFIPVICTRYDDAHVDGHFAVITRAPNPEVRAAGHDRTPVTLDFNNSNDLARWLTPQNQTAAQLLGLLNNSSRMVFRHELAN